MLHSLRLKDGKVRRRQISTRGSALSSLFPPCSPPTPLLALQAVAYANHWVRTDRFQQERKLGLPVYTKVGRAGASFSVPASSCLRRI